MEVNMDTYIIYTEGALLVEEADSRVVFGLSAFAPNGFGFVLERDKLIPAADRYRLATYSYMTRTRSVVNLANSSMGSKNVSTVTGNLQSLSWGTGVDKLELFPGEPLVQRNNVSIEPGVTFTSLEAQWTNIPIANLTYPLYSHVDGGGFINVVGGPFVDATSLSCRWRIIDSFCECEQSPVSATCKPPLARLPPEDWSKQCLVYSPRVIFVNATYIVCVTPPVSKAMTAKMFVSLSGVVWSIQEQENFIFFTTGSPVGRSVLVASSKGGGTTG